jgi:hypothetical protein
VREYDDEVMLCVVNLSRSAQPVELDLPASRDACRWKCSAEPAFPPIGELPYLLTLPGHGTYCFRLTPLAICWDDQTSEEERALLASWALARVRQQDRTGLLYGAFGSDGFCRDLAEGIGRT